MTRPAERLRWLTPGSSIAFASVIALLAWSLLSARSPLALTLADAAAGSGHTSLAISRYDAIGAVSLFKGHRALALWRSGNLLALDLRDPSGARSRFRKLSVMEGAPHRAQAYERIGRILLHKDHRPDAAAIALHDAYKVDPAAPEAPRRLRHAAMAYAEAGQTDQALAALETLELGHADWRGRAQLGRAALHLAHDDEAAALAAYRDALETDDATVHAVARLGSATCLERLGNLDEALAELDAADLPDDVRDARAGSMRARRLVEE